MTTSTIATKTKTRPMAKMGLAAACALGLTLAGCGDGADGGTEPDGANGGGAETVTSTVTEGAPPEETTTEMGDSGDSEDSTTTSEAANCGVDENAPIIESSIQSIDPPTAGEYWELAETNYDPCGELTYALFQQMPQGNAQFATKILMFHEGEYLGVDTNNAQQGQIVGEADDWFEVKYKDWEALRDSGEANAAAPKYTTNVTFTWDDDAQQVATDGRFPNENL
ncbi:LppP/LprE family lipoprotein [uncultured Corynebacterium sp.]|uniref:LppP/LprE family lipoprotein n=1 Tax=uncultured Corynebacterium sp. TaxID=159447 RepID=UPI0025D9E55F|nr:LppP/LprE family lipoprotein [uncultured Corynebacterium sp.]